MKGIGKWLIGVAIAIAVLFVIGQLFPTVAAPINDFIDVLLPAAT
jgi:hypothetical protein